MQKNPNFLAKYVKFFGTGSIYFTKEKGYHWEIKDSEGICHLFEPLKEKDEEHLKVGDKVFIAMRKHRSKEKDNIWQVHQIILPEDEGYFNFIFHNKYSDKSNYIPRPQISFPSKNNDHQIFIVQKTFF